MNNLDKAIKDTDYILECLLTYRDIVKSGDCNTCESKSTCEYAPKPGQLVRYNCPFYKKREIKNDRPGLMVDNKDVVSPRNCPKCGYYLIIDNSKVYTSNPPKYRYYCMNCDYEDVL